MTLSAGPIPRAPVRSFNVIAILKDPLQRPRLVKHIVSAPVTFSKKNVERYGLSFSKLLKIKLAIKFSLMYNNKIENIYF